MPPLAWPADPMKIVQGFEGRRQNPTAGALFAWAAFTAETLHYLDDIDSAFDHSHQPFAGHKPDIVDVAHARWATGASITAMDLCAAGLARTFCQHRTRQELALGDFEPRPATPSPKKAARRAQLPAAAVRWVDAVFDDLTYTTVKEARDWLTHSRVRRHIIGNVGGPPMRLELDLSARIGVRELVEVARDLATRHVLAFFDILPQL